PFINLDRTGFNPSLEDYHGVPNSRWPWGSVALPTCMWSSLRSISSRRRKIRERLSSEVKNSPNNEAPAGGGKGGMPGWGPKLAEQINLGPRSAAVGHHAAHSAEQHDDKVGGSPSSIPTSQRR